MIKSIDFYAAEQPGQRFWFSGAVHGRRSLRLYRHPPHHRRTRQRPLQLVGGQLTFVRRPIRRAYELDTVSPNASESPHVVPTKTPDTYEARIGNILSPLLDACDVLLDIHSYGRREPFISVTSRDAKEPDFAASLGPAPCSPSWEQAYAATGRGAANAKSDEGPAHRICAPPRRRRRHYRMRPAQGAEAPEVAYQAILNALAFLGMIETANPKIARPGRLVRHACVLIATMKARCNAPGSISSRFKGVVIATAPTRRLSTAPGDGFVIMPRADCPIRRGMVLFRNGRQGRGATAREGPIRLASCPRRRASIFSLIK